MGRISIDNLQPGMVLASDAFTFRKQLLLQAGSVLSVKNIDILKTWGVSEIEIEGYAEPTLEEVEKRLASHPELASANSELDYRFSGVREHQLMKEILTIAKKQLLESH